MQNNEVEYLMGPLLIQLLFQYLEHPDGILIDLIMSDNEYVSHSDYTEWQAQQDVMKL